LILLQAGTPKKKPVLHIYAFAVTWFIYFALALDFKLIDMRDIVEELLIISLFVCIGVRILIALCRFAFTETPVISEDGTVKPTASRYQMDTPLTGNPEVDALITEGHIIISDIKRVGGGGRGGGMSKKVDSIVKVSRKIVDKLRRNPSLMSSTRRFFSYLLPTAQKLVVNYAYMEKQDIESGNISETMQKIEDSLDKLAIAFKKQLDNLFSNTALDLSTDMDVLDSILKQEGLIDEQNFIKEKKND
jgi:hypothetical protein